MKTALVLGSDGYLGHALTLKLLHKGYKVVGADDYRRRHAVIEMGSFSATPILSSGQRMRQFFKDYDENFDFRIMALEENYHMMCELMRQYKPDVIVNLAQQPAAPYSHKSRNHAIRTSVGNIVGTINLLYAMYENAPDAPLVQIGTMGEYDPAVNVDIAEGVFEFEFNGRKSNTAIFPRRPGSWYHTSKVASTYYIDAACRWWGLKATDIMQGVVYGSWTPEIDNTKNYTRLDSDESFGTVIHRFVVQSVIGEPMTVYGEGLHKRGFLALNDSMQCLELAIETPPEDENYRTWNQLDTVHSMNELAEAVQKVAKNYGINAEIDHIESPRKEYLQEHYYNPLTDKLNALGFEPTRQLEEEIDYMFSVLVPRKDALMDLKNVVIPKIKWESKDEA